MPINVNTASGPASGPVGSLTIDECGNYYITTETGFEILPEPVALAINAIHPIDTVSTMLTGQSGDIANTVFLTSAGDRLYRINVYVNSREVGAASSTLSLTLKWTDNFSLHTLVALSGVPLDTAGAASYIGAFFVPDTAIMSFLTTVTGGDGSEIYGVIIVTERLADVVF